MEQLRRAARLEAAAAQRKRLVRSVPDLAGSDDVDLAAALRLLAGSRVEVVVPAAEVPLPACDVEELVAVAREVLADSARRAGPDTKALVLIEDFGEEVVLTVRDEEPGPTDARLAEANGRVGAPRSIRGRVADLGATLTLDTRPGQGMEWEVRLARATVDE
ncbi:MAG: MacS family sensor histidine kinase, partial [Pseudonocardiaceae bacterium]